MARAIGFAVLVALLGVTTTARAGTIIVQAFELKDGTPLNDAGQQTFTIVLTTKAGRFVVIRTPDGKTQTLPTPNDPRLNLTFTAPNTFRLDVADNLFPANTDVDVIVQAILSGRIPAQPVPGVIGTATSTLTLAFPEIPPACAYPMPAYSKPKHHFRLFSR